jgi:RimJ/RimL family protein N-acetyltransferase
MPLARVVLRPFREDEFDLLVDRLRYWLPDFDDDEDSWRESTHARIARSGDWTARDIDFAIEIGGRLAGAVQALGDFWRLPAHVYELGIELYDERDRGRGLGRETLSLFVPRVFQDGARRLQGRTHVENAAMIRLFERSGFVREGVLRSYWPLPHHTGDVVLYAMTSADYAGSPLAATR